MPFIFNGQTMYRFSSLFIYNIVLIDWIKTFFQKSISILMSDEVLKPFSSLFSVVSLF